MRQGIDRRRARRLDCGDGVQRLRLGVSLSSRHAGDEVLGRHPAKGDQRDRRLQRGGRRLGGFAGLLGVGYILGPRIGAILVGGGLLSSFVLIPAIYFFGGNSTVPLYPGDAPISTMSSDTVFKVYVRYIGAGAVATGGIISMLHSLPLIFGSLVGGLRDLRGRESRAAKKRTEQDLSLWIVGFGSLALIAAIAATHLIPTDPLGRVIGAAMILVFGFLFVTVSSRLTGLIGSSSNPISGMTIATLLLTCAFFYFQGWIGTEYRVAALSIAAVVCIASSNGGTTSQDLKTGYLVGATPKKQQIAILVGALTSAVVIGGTLLLLNSASSVKTNKPEYLPKVALQESDLLEGRTDVGPDGKAYRVARLADPRLENGAVVIQPGRYLVDESLKATYLDDPGIGGRVAERDNGQKVTKFAPPQPALFAVIIDGIMKGKLPWGLVLLGVFLAIVMQLAGVSPLAFAVGVYLPLATTLPIFIGGAIRALIDRVKKLKPEESDMSPAILLSTGLIAGGSIAGILCNLLQLDFAEKLAMQLDMTKRLPKGWLERPLPAVCRDGLVGVRRSFGRFAFQETVVPRRSRERRGSLINEFSLDHNNRRFHVHEMGYSLHYARRRRGRAAADGRKRARRRRNVDVRQPADADSQGAARLRADQGLGRSSSSFGRSIQQRRLRLVRLRRRLGDDQSPRRRGYLAQDQRQEQGLLQGRFLGQDARARGQGARP